MYTEYIFEETKLVLSAFQKKKTPGNCKATSQAGYVTYYKNLRATVQELNTGITEESIPGGEYKKYNKYENVEYKLI
jgi:hypothetical protein